MVIVHWFQFNNYFSSTLDLAIKSVNILRYGLSHCLSSFPLILFIGVNVIGWIQRKKRVAKARTEGNAILLKLNYLSLI